VFYEEPLPSSSPLWGLDNVLMSAHTADRTKEFQFESMQLFCDIMRKYVETGDLTNVVDKTRGY
jgi:phosphoglycerate dehydrogenase-like enzyme